jgi:hypothetical protein
MTIETKDVIYIVALAISVMITLLTLFFRTGRESGEYATKGELADLAKEVRAAIAARANESQQEHRNYATKSEVTKIEAAMFDDIKELRGDLKAGITRIDRQYEKMLGYMDGLISQITGRKKGTPQDE